MPSLKSRYQVDLIPASYSTKDYNFQMGFRTIIFDDNPRYSYFTARPKIFKMTPLPSVGNDTEVDLRANRTTQKVIITKSGDVLLSDVEGLDEKHLKLLKDAGFKTIGHVLLPDAEDDDVADLTVIKGIGQSSHDKILETVDDFASKWEADHTD